MLEWIDEEFFETGAFMELQTEEILLSKGGVARWVDQLPETLEENIFYLKDFYSRKTLIYSPRETLRISKDELSKLHPEKSSVKITNSHDETYKKDFHKLMTSFGENLSKVVLISRENYESTDPLHTRRQLIIRGLTSKLGFPYGLWTKQIGIVGSTPELLFDQKDREIQTFALAGTSVAGKESALLNSSKDKIEHELVVRNIQEILKRNSSSVSTGDLRIQSYGDLIHLRTDIKASLFPDVRTSDLINELSPTAALGGYPKKNALEFLKETEYQKHFPDRIFGSAFGVSSQKSMRFLVLIRNVQWNEDTFFIESGGGVVPSSVLEDELLEISRKRSLIRSFYFKT